MTDLIWALKGRVWTRLASWPSFLLLCDTRAITTALPHVSRCFVDPPFKREPSSSCRIDGGSLHLPRAERVVLIPSNLIDAEVSGISGIKLGAVMERIDALTEGDGNRLPTILCPNPRLPLLCDLAWRAPP
jgi:hypothetical protein